MKNRIIKTVTVENLTPTADEKRELAITLSTKDEMYDQIMRLQEEIRQLKRKLREARIK